MNVRFAWDGLALIKRGDERFVNEPHVGGGNPIASSKGTTYFNDMLGTTVGAKHGHKYSPAALTAFGKTIENDFLHSPTPTHNSNSFFTGKPEVASLGHAFLFRNYRASLAKWQAAAPVVSISAQAAQAQADQLRAQAAQLQAQAAQLQAQAAQVQPIQALPAQQVNPLAGLITMADAKRIALAAAGVVETDARNFKVELDSEGVLMLYEVEFNSGFHEYEYKIDARTGAIVGTKKKLDIF